MYLEFDLASMILVTGHEPPDGFDSNPSATLARRLDGESVDGTPIRGLVLPTDPRSAGDAVVAAMAERTPSVVLSAGFDPGRAGIVVERLAFADGDWLAIRDETPEPDSPVGYVSTLSTDALLDQYRKRDIPTTLAVYATSRLSDRVLFDAMEHVVSEELETAVGSLALPCTPEQAIRRAGRNGTEQLPPSVPAETQLEALLVAVKLTLRLQQREADDDSGTDDDSGSDDDSGTDAASGSGSG